jgi:hypothetical protein
VSETAELGLTKQTDRQGEVKRRKENKKGRRKKVTLILSISGGAHSCSFLEEDERGESGAARLGPRKTKRIGKVKRKRINEAAKEPVGSGGMESFSSLASNNGLG